MGGGSRFSCSRTLLLACFSKGPASVFCSGHKIFPAGLMSWQVGQSFGKLPQGGGPIGWVLRVSVLQFEHQRLTGFNKTILAKPIFRRQKKRVTEPLGGAWEFWKTKMRRVFVEAGWERWIFGTEILEHHSLTVVKIQTDSSYQPVPFENPAKTVRQCFNGFQPFCTLLPNSWIISKVFCPNGFRQKNCPNWIFQPKAVFFPEAILIHS